MLNALTLEERQRLRLDRTAYKWFAQMTEAEKARFSGGDPADRLQTDDHRL